MIEILVLLSISATKFFFAPGIAISRGYGTIETLLITTVGGILGIVFFYFFGEFFFAQYDRLARKFRKNRRPKTFSRKNKLIVKVKGKWGLYGLALITPVLLSIPIGSVIAARFFNTQRQTIPVLILSVFIWSIALTFASQFIF